MKVSDLRDLLEGMNGDYVVYFSQSEGGCDVVTSCRISKLKEVESGYVVGDQGAYEETEGMANGVILGDEF